MDRTQRPIGLGARMEIETPKHINVPISAHSYVRI